MRIIHIRIFICAGNGESCNRFSKCYVSIAIPKRGIHEVYCLSDFFEVHNLMKSCYHKGLYMMCILISSAEAESDAG